MEFEWDPYKNQANIQKHGVRFEDACQIFQGPTLDIRDDRRDYGEVRTISIGQIGHLVILTVVHTDRNGKRRLISARPAKQSERKIYAVAIQRTYDA